MNEGTDTSNNTPVAEAAAVAETSTPATPGIETENATAQTEQSEPAQTDGSEAANDEGDDGDKPRRLNRTQRLQRKNQYLQSTVLRLEEKIAELSKPREAIADDGDFVKQIERGLDDKLRTQKLDDLKDRIADIKAEMQQDLAADFEDRAAATRSSIPDFDDVIQKFMDDGGILAPSVAELIGISEKGPQVAYHIAKRPELARRLNSLTPSQAAYEILRIEANLSREPTKRSTLAPPPQRQISGGATPAPDLAALAKPDDATSFIEERNRRERARA